VDLADVKKWLPLRVSSFEAEEVSTRSDREVDPREVGLMPMVRLSRELETILGEKVDLASRHVLAEHVAARALTEAIDV
jgi:predicted nucleotidyltransferase